MKIRWTRRIKKTLMKLVSLYLPLAVILLFVVFPFYWVVNMAFKQESDIRKIPIQYIANPITLDNFKVAWNSFGFSTYMMNSLLIAICSVLIITTVSVFTGYGLSRFSFKGKNLFLIMLLCTQLIPGAMLLIPLFTIFNHLGLINSRISLVMVYTAFEIPFCSLLMRGFLSDIPIDLEEAAMIDGCSRLKAIYKVIIPILIPSIIAIGAFAFIASWNEFLFGLMFINEQSKFTISVGLSYMIGQYTTYYGALAAGSVIALLPTLFIFGYVQKYLVQGMSAGSVKG